MNSAASEEQTNVFLMAIRPGGILYPQLQCAPMEVLCCPRQSSLVETGFAPYLSLPAPVENSVVTLSINETTFHLTSTQQEKVSQVLREEFLVYHTLRFASVASSSFVTGRGHKGEFSSDLKSIARFGRIGACAVIGDSITVQLQQREERTLPDGGVNVFILEEPFMDASERQNSIAALKRAVGCSDDGSPQNALGSSGGASPSGPMQGREWRYTREAIESYRRGVSKETDERFAEFQQLMKKPMCFPIVKTLSGFLEAVDKRDSLQIKSSHVTHAITLCMNQCRQIPLLLDDWEKLRIIEEGLEKHIMTKLFKRTFGVCPEEQKCEAELSEKLHRLSKSVRAQDLEALEEVESHNCWEQAMYELDAMNFFKSPRGKFLCSLRAYQQLTEIVRDTVAEIKKARGKNPNKALDADDFGANEFLPCFLLLVLRACPRNFYLNVQYVKNFHSPDRMTPEESYCLATLESAVSFWQSYSNASTGTVTPACAVPAAPAPVSSAPVPVVEPQLQPQANFLDSLFTSPASSIIIPTSGPVDLSSSYNFDDFFNGGGGTVLTPPKKENKINVTKLLLDDKKAFDDLSVAELRAVVEEARSLLAEKRNARS
ncbi:hypothetical protein, conserved [Trypanosoma brucei brucei TREU927]|uniref:VPS9 domain-containing protein n=1 Tax=Trypanosoma brucei brucei (strain 927/4 GUTat10.1) TaxID=185431 RepID=Q389X4_TRYB2|nr:hypothetical protein, conserved [Trypanosoma brucei brucei TREU927]EAN78396.1 hypothetical protein, conserved [Trypanosoma brucei brucei TREU927]